MDENKSSTVRIDEAFMQAQLELIKSRAAGVSTGFRVIDELWGGLKPGATYLIGSRPKRRNCCPLAA